MGVARDPGTGRLPSRGPGRSSAPGAGRFTLPDQSLRKIFRRYRKRAKAKTISRPTMAIASGP